MRCPCGGELRAVRTVQRAAEETWRKRKCRTCGRPQWTTEIPDAEFKQLVREARS